MFCYRTRASLSQALKSSTCSPRKISSKTMVWRLSARLAGVWKRGLGRSMTGLDTNVKLFFFLFGLFAFIFCADAAKRIARE